MWINIIFILIVLIFTFVGFTGYSLAKNNANNSACNLLSKSEYTNKLEQLPKNIDIIREPISAMCYDTAVPLDRIQYVCPVCGEMTLYPSTSNIGNEAQKAPYYRSLVDKITKIDVKLDESQLCEKCNPNAKSRELCLIVKFDKNSKPHKTCGITGIDINSLYEYSEGKNIDGTSMYLHTPLTNNEKNRLEELLGVKIKNNDK